MSLNVEIWLQNLIPLKKNLFCTKGPQVSQRFWASHLSIRWSTAIFFCLKINQLREKISIHEDMHIELHIQGAWEMASLWWSRFLQGRTFFLPSVARKAFVWKLFLELPVIGQLLQRLGRPRPSPLNMPAAILVESHPAALQGTSEPQQGAPEPRIAIGWKVSGRSYLSPGSVRMRKLKPAGKRLCAAWMLPQRSGPTSPGFQSNWDRLRRERGVQPQLGSLFL